jgi:cytochrome b6-f complex iron-sulfur subunit
MTPLARTLTGLAGGWLASRTLGLVARLQAGHGSAGAKKLTSRRSFTRNAALASALIVTAEIAAGTVYLLWPNKTGAFGGEITLAADNVPDVDGAPFRYSEGKFYLVHSADGLQALYWKCVHLGCTVPWVAGQQHFVCPCHGSVYAYDGQRISGPAPRSMDAFPVTVNSDGGVTVDTNPSTVIVRSTVEPSQMTPYDA